MSNGGSPPKGARCADPAHGKADTCPGWGARFASVWWAKYYVNGKAVRRSTGTAKETEARRLLKQWEGNPQAFPKTADRATFEDLCQDYLTDYRVNGKKSLERAMVNVQALKTFFLSYRRAVTITTSDVREFIAKRQKDAVSNATINRELAVLKRMFTLALQVEKLPRRPHIPMLEENNVRTGFFSEADCLALREALPEC